MIPLAKIRRMAKNEGWRELTHQTDIGMLSFGKQIDDSPARINVYTTKMTVATSLKHPRRGKTQMYRKHVDKKLLKAIFENPRVHTNRGYTRKLKQ